MDNHEYNQMLFPCPSSSSSSSAYSSDFHNLLGLSNNSSINAGEGSSLTQTATLSRLGNDIEGTDPSGRGDQVNNDKKKKKKKERKERFVFQTRSQVDILDDGYRWRKYGQKAVKNNRFPSVKKQVQRLTRDEGVVVTTYDGVHTHAVDKPSDDFQHILSQMHVYTPF
ncbi:PREDICTED: probable WRKY transcription factor 45 isoform X2 [Tarenaya hassleriana]|uniref:probable WRKY transcription factor 45 isoform X2 n=1 Tax=Tarenaya hassleriana TaxID=28532 RepID=UPI00053C1C86|nr:PREDICTED: probable WRKY transcription factor 45 isoform X2 [Tarenaya hassleriana]